MLAARKGHYIKHLPTIHSIQYLRALAALMVIFHHSSAQIDIYRGTLKQVNIGAAGVDVFFVISGFVIWFTTYNRKLSPAKFMLKRIIRVVPLYWFVTLAIVVAGTAIPTLFKATRFEWP